MSDDLRDEMAGVLAAHRFLDRNMAGDTGCRGCQWTTPFRGVRGRTAHEHHQADALAPLLARREAEARAAGWQIGHTAACSLGLYCSAHQPLAASEPKP